MKLYFLLLALLIEPDRNKTLNSLIPVNVMERLNKVSTVTLDTLPNGKLNVRAIHPNSKKDHFLTLQTEDLRI